MSTPDEGAGAVGSHRLPLGRLARTGELVWSEEHPVVVTAGLAGRRGAPSDAVLAALAAWPGPVLCIGAGAGLVEAGRATRSLRGPVWDVDLSGARRGDRLDLFPADLTYAAAQDFAAAMTVPFARGDVREGAFWATKAGQQLAPLLLAASRESHGEQARRLVQMLHESLEYEVLDLLLDVGGSDGEDALSDHRHIQDMTEVTRANIGAVTTAAVAAFRREAAVHALGHGGVRPQQLVADGGTLFLTVPVSDQDVVAPLATAVITHVVRAAELAAQRTGQPSGLLVVVDGAGVAAKLPALPTWATSLASSGTSLLASFALLEHLHLAYGEDGTAAVVAPASAVLVGGTASPRAADLLDDWAGADVDGMPLGTGRLRLRSVGRGHAVLLRPHDEPALVRLLSPGVDPALGWSLGM
ncbi:type IV secretory system conjugative DNA transfer family protein [Quadrisphaera sp. KR29]|uniref:type IV secretory system conjugative DNA transfer family protein n=1 Tax=Quadrisphaera sp. KR29 TaxID=3461391 RepID=UPI0040442804